MESVVLVIHLFLALAIIGLVLLQRSEGGGLGLGGGGGGLGNFATAENMGNALTRATTICAIAFFCTSLALGIMARSHSTQKQSIMDAFEQAPAPAAAGDVQPEPEETPSAPLPE